MRYRYYPTVILMSLILFFTSCKKDENGYWGTVSAQKNGVQFEGEIKAVKTSFAQSKATIIIKNFDSAGIPLETLGFVKIPLGVGKYKLSYTFDQPPDDSLKGCIYNNGYDDQVYDSFLLSQTDSTSFLEITEYNEGNGELRGKFNLILWPEPGIPGSWNAPDSLVFSDGVFHTRIN